MCCVCTKGLNKDAGLCGSGSLSTSFPWRPSLLPLRALACGVCGVFCSLMHSADIHAELSTFQGQSPRGRHLPLAQLGAVGWGGEQRCAHPGAPGCGGEIGGSWGCGGESGSRWQGGLWTPTEPGHPASFPDRVLGRGGGLILKPRSWCRWPLSRLSDAGGSRSLPELSVRYSSLGPHVTLPLPPWGHTGMPPAGPGRGDSCLAVEPGAGQWGARGG